MKKTLLAISTAILMNGAAFAADFHGYDPQTFDGAMLTADQLQAMVASAAENAPPKNGENM